MSILNKIAYFQNRRDEIPNQALARELVGTQNKADIAEIAQNLWHKEKNIQSDCLKVLYEMGYLRPDLIADYYLDYLKLLQSKNNRLVWGAMIALSTMADLKAKDIWPQIGVILRTIEKGSVITVVSGVKTLCKIALAANQYKEELWPFLLKQLQICVPRDIPIHSESILQLVDEKNQQAYFDLIEKRKTDMSQAQYSRLKSIIRKWEKFKN